MNTSCKKVTINSGTVVPKEQSRSLGMCEMTAIDATALQETHCASSGKVTGKASGSFKQCMKEKVCLF